MFQPVYERLLRVSLLGMNVGAGSDVDSSGEGAFLRAVARLFRREAGPLVVVDGGANIGDYTNAVLQAMGSRVEVLALEPSGQTFARLRANVSASAGVRFSRMPRRPASLRCTSATFDIRTRRFRPAKRFRCARSTMCSTTWVSTVCTS
jgi:hypothetical protein